MYSSIKPASIIYRSYVLIRTGICVITAKCARVAEVASLGGFVKQYQITADPNKLLVYNIPITKLVDAVKNGNEESAAGFWSLAVRSTWCVGMGT